MTSGFNMGMQQHKKAPRTKEDRKSALFQLLVLRRSVDDLDAAELSRIHGVPVQIVAPMLEAEQQRRMMRS
ncbi:MULTISPECIES: hypothetical protein [unclassified Novosphingobium]|uniref:hypothetical protein n=1 Tax=unclassified Novosphingobium TaxID=2644732 RepID=UPI001358ADE0|nr:MULTISPECIES: hypothetical protein [unclassified Novosphingobium]